MDAIKRIVSEITFMCRLRNVTVSDTLAAFVAHTIVLEHSAMFPLDKELNEADVQDLVRMAVERLLTPDSASLETVKMQVAFDTAKLDELDALEAARTERDNREQLLLRGIVEAKLKGTNDTEALTALYRRIFNFLVLRAGLEPSANRAAEREIAAALESVFPRIGLKAFTLLPQEDKTAQLHELANIVLGIRLFNRSIGKGGAGIEDFPAVSRSRCQEILRLTGTDMEAVGMLCDQYVEVISFRHSQPRQESLAKLSQHERDTDSAAVTRFQEELTNRRQYAAFLSLLFDGLQQSAKHIAELEHMFDKIRTHQTINSTLHEMDNLKQLVGSRTSVPKEQVYPRFDALAKLWIAFEDEAQMLQVRRQTLDVLHTYRASFTPHLKSEDVSNARAARRAAAAALDVATAISMAPVEATASGKGPKDARHRADAPPPAAGTGAGSTACGDSMGRSGTAGERAGGEGAGGGTAGSLLDQAAADDDTAERIPADFAPSMLQLSLELEGFCLVTLVAKAGLLLPGSAEQIVRFRKRYYACVDAAAADAFMAEPNKYVQGALAQATKSPELIHLLRLQEHFPGASISEVMRKARATARTSTGDLLGAPAKLLQDAQVQTLLHTKDKHIDHDYEFSEWALRRRALQLANLRQKQTRSQQTVGSHFRREAETQVYPPHESTTQTATTKGTEAVRMVNYIKGMRGHPDSEMHIVNLTIDPGS